MPASTPLRPLVDALEQMTALDPVAKTVGKAARDFLGVGRPRTRSAERGWGTQCTRR